MRYVTLEDTIYQKFTTRDYDTGAPQTLGGTPAVSAYEDANLTQITAGITLTADYDSVTGLNHLAVAATAANGYEVGKYYALVITTGTVDGVSVVGEVVDEFVVGRVPADMTAVSGDTTAADNLELDYDGTGYAKANSTIGTCTTLTGHTVQTGDSFARIGVAGAGLTNINLPNQTMDITGNLSGSVGSVTGNVGGSVASVVGHTAQTGDTYDLLTSGSGNVDINRLWIYNTDGGANDYGFQARSDSAHAFRCAALGGSGQHGFLAIGSSTNGSGVVGQGNGTGSGVYAYAAGTGGGFIMQSVSGDSLTESAGGTAVIATIDSKIDTVDSVVDAILVDTGTTIPATLGSPAGASMSADIATVDGNVDAVKVITDALTAAAAANLALSAAGIIGGTASGTPTTTTMDSDLSGYADDELIGRTVIWTGGTANGQASDITDYASTSGVVTFTAITTAPVSGDTFVVV